MSIKEFDGGLTGNQEITVGIDQSLTGFALSAVSVEFPNLHKTWVFKSEYRGVQRLDDIGNWFYSKLTELHFDGNTVVNVAMEGTVLQSQAASILGELAGITKVSLFTFFDARVKPDCALPLQVPPMTLKKYATGKGTAKKQEMLLQIYKRWGVEFNDDNAADAYALARLATGSAIDAIERETQDKIKDPKYRDSLAF
jgi:Holliday junction resolvasome RuvABC endonuclease subunit